MTDSKDVGDALTESIRSKEAIELAAEYLEIGIDSVLDEEVLRDLPAVGTIRALAKIGAAFRDRLLARKILRFLSGLHELSEDERLDMIERIESDDAFGQRLGEHLIELLDRMDSHRKPEMVAAVFVAFAKGEIDLLMLRRLIHVIVEIPDFAIPTIRPFRKNFPALDALPSNPPLSEPDLQMMVRVGLAKMGSGHGALVYEPTPTCAAFVKLKLDRLGVDH